MYVVAGKGSIVGLEVHPLGNEILVTVIPGIFKLSIISKLVQGTFPLLQIEI